MTELSRPRVRVLHVIWRLSSGGGVQRVVRDLLTHVDPSAVEFHVITVRPHIADDGLDAFPGVSFHHAGFAGQLSALDRLRLLRRVRSTARRVRPDVVQLHSGTAWVGLALVGRRRTRTILEVHDAPGNGRHSRWTERLEGFLARLFHWELVAHSTSSARETEARWKLRPGSITRFPLGVAIPGPDAKRLDRTELTPHPAAVIVTNVSRLVPSKNVALGIEAVAAARSRGADVDLAVVGDGPERDALEQLAVTLGINEHVRFVGTVSPADPAIRASDIVLSTSDYEGFGLVPAEAMANGISVIATAVGGCTDVVQHGETGILAPQGDLNAITNALIALADDGELRRRLGTAGADYAAEHLDVERTAKHWTAMYLSTQVGPTDSRHVNGGRLPGRRSSTSRTDSYD